MTRTNYWLLIAAAATINLAASVSFAFVVYDDFTGSGTVSNAKWGSASAMPSYSNGLTVSNLGIRSTATFPVGSTLRIEMENIGPTGFYVFGTNSNPPPAGPAVDAMFIRNDSGASFYVDGARQGPNSAGSTAPATFDFVFDHHTLGIIRDGTVLASMPRPAAFDEPQRFELGTYSNGQLVVNRVLHRAPADSYAPEVLADDPFVYLRMQETDVATGNTGWNSGISSTHGTYHQNGGSFVDMPSFSATAPGKQFLGNSFMALDQPAAYSALQDFTVEFLLRPETYEPQLQAIYASDSWATGSVHLNLLGSKLELAINGNSGPFPNIDLASLAPLNEWTYLAVAYEGGAADAVSFYVNGVLEHTQATGNPGGAVTGNFDRPARIGAWNSGRYLSGSLDEFAIYGTALSADRIAAHYAGIPEPSSAVLLLMAAAVALAWRRRRTR